MNGRPWIDVVLALWATRVAWEASRYFLARGTRGRFHVESALLILVAACLLAALVGRRHRADAPAGHAAPQPVPARWLAAACVGAAIVSYSPVLGIGFLSDDFVLAAAGEAGAAFAVETRRFFRPLAPLLLGGLGLSPASLHLSNVVLHGLNAFLVGVVARETGARSATAAAAAGLFLTFPAAPEAVAWCSGIQDVLMTTLGLTFVLAWGWRRPLPWRLAAALSALVVGLAVKETSIAFPALALVTWLGSERLSRTQWTWLAGATGALVLVYAVWRLTGPGLPEGYAEPLSRWRLKEILVRTFAALAAPWHRDLGAVGTALGLAGGILFPLLLVLNVRAWRDDPAAFGRVARATAWILFAVAPVYGFLYIGAGLEGSRYVYLAEAGWAMVTAEMLAGGLSVVTRRMAPAIAVSALVVLVSLAALRAHLGPWIDAARARDATLAAARDRLESLGCRRPTFDRLPDSVRGAYVFRNGFAEALRKTAPELGAPRGPECRLVWDGRAFESR